MEWVLNHAGIQPVTDEAFLYRSASREDGARLDVVLAERFWGRDRQRAFFDVRPYGKPYRKTINWLRCQLSFSLLRSAIMCLRGYRSSHHNPINSFGGEIKLALVKGRVVEQNLNCNYIGIYEFVGKQIN
jgi:hypothetical protein